MSRDRLVHPLLPDLAYCIAPERVIGIVASSIHEEPKAIEKSRRSDAKALHQHEMGEEGGESSVGCSKLRSRATR